MGCDIHSLVEVKENGEWKVNDFPVFIDRDWDGKDKETKSSQWPDDRNYDWFAILADVRNGSGFAGVKTGMGFIPLDLPRGVPDDASEEWNQKVENWNGDMHSHSYMYLSDFDNYDWTRKTTKTGAISLSQYKELQGTNNTPDSWSGSIGGGNNITISQEEADVLLNNGEVSLEERDWFGRPRGTIIKVTEKSHSVNVQYSWKITYSEWFKYNLENLVEPLRELAAKYEDVRVVFGFDN